MYSSSLTMVPSMLPLEHNRLAVSTTTERSKKSNRCSKDCNDVGRVDPDNAPIKRFSNLFLNSSEYNLSRRKVPINFLDSNLVFNKCCTKSTAKPCFVANSPTEIEPTSSKYSLISIARLSKNKSPMISVFSFNILNVSSCAIKSSAASSM